MSERGVFAVDRGIWEHDLLTDSEPFSRREAWLWLLSEAAWKPHRRRIVGRPFELDRGQLVASTRFIASKWRWSEPRVRRFLSALISEQMIGANTDAGVSVITICKYDEYQRVSLPSDAMRKSDDDAGATQERRKVEDKEDKEGTEAIASAPIGKPVYSDSRHELWGEGTAILEQLGVSAKAAKPNIGRWLKSAGDDALHVLGAIQRARDNRIIDPIPWITQALRNGANGQQSYHNRTAQGSGSTGQDAMLAGLGRIADRIRQRGDAERREREMADGDDAARGDDARLI